MTETGPRIVSMPEKADEMMAAVEALRRGLPALVASAPLIAKVRRAHFDALIHEGFTEAQALQLCLTSEL
ncbi:hypothetical protein [Jannaschia formosa]|uniref:hypothetical protein n=1 Tax=Jannaschia formosa TaxID=2259592 RepID=UPI000E1BBA27|nr:hypothetical protein [Jannaschia formosa]TFL16435.1 hypothetical protein DR046_20150 [Jannaschia formosa]